MPESDTNVQNRQTTAVPGTVAFVPSGPSLEANKELVRRYEEAFIAGKIDTFDEFVAKDYIENMPVPIKTKGLEGLKEMANSMKGVFTEAAYEEQELFAEGDRVIERWKIRMKHTGKDPFFGEPSGKTIHFKGIDIFRIADGKIAEHWSEMDMLGALQQTGAKEIPSLPGT